MRECDPSSRHATEWLKGFEERGSRGNIIPNHIKRRNRGET
jgi:hypothetical protein